MQNSRTTQRYIEADVDAQKRVVVQSRSWGVRSKRQQRHHQWAKVRESWLQPLPRSDRIGPIAIASR